MADASVEAWVDNPAEEGDNLEEEGDNPAEEEDTLVVGGHSHSLEELYSKDTKQVINLCTRAKTTSKQMSLLIIWV